MAAENSPSERELDLLKVLWQLGSASVREVQEAMQPHADLAFNTVQTLLRNMEEKDLVEHRAEGRTFIYKPKYSRERVASRFLSKVFDGALDQFVLTILRSRDTSPEELKELERFIANVRREKQSRREGGK